MNDCDNCGRTADLFHNEATGLAFCEPCDLLFPEGGTHMLEGAENVRVHMDDGKLVVTIDLGVSLGPSKTGRSEIVGTTRGFKPVPGIDGIGLNVNVTRKP